MGNHRSHEAALVEIVESSPGFMRALRAVQALGLDSWCIGAGALRALVWDRLHGHPLPTAVPDLDVAYFDPSDIAPESERALQHRLADLLPGVPWEVANQAAVHLWYEEAFGLAVEPLPSLLAGIASWPEFATAVAVSLDADSRLVVLAPCGLDDLFSMVVRRNPARISEAAYRQRLRQKQYPLRWPKVRVLPC